MPQITSCPECSKKLRVPDELIGKKVKCPGCTTMFFAEVDDPEEDGSPFKDFSKAPAKSPPPIPAGRGRSDAVTSRPRSKSRDEEEEEAPRSRRRDRDEDDEDRPSRRRRDEDDDDDDDDDRHSSTRQQIDGWQKVQRGTNFVVISGWISLSIFGIYLIGGGVMLLMGGSVIATLVGGGNPRGAMGGAGALLVLWCGGMLIVALLGLTSFILLLTGVGFCMATPRLRGQSMKGMATAAFFCFIGGFVAYLFAVVVGQISLGLALFGLLLQLAAMLAMFVGHVLWLLYLRQVCLYFRDDSLARTVLTTLIVQIAFPFAGFIIIFALMLLVGASLNMGGAGISGGIIAIIIVYGLFFLSMIGVYMWYIFTLQKVRDLVEYKADRI